MATVKDLAKAAGVSVGTVSNVLNGKSSVKEHARERVYQAIKDLDFKYNMTASALRTKATKNIGLVIPTIVNPYYPELARGVEDAARDVGCTLFLCNSDRKADKEKNYISSLLSRATDGIILVKTGLDDTALKELSEKTALVLIDYEVKPEHSFLTVNVKDAEGIVQGMNLLKQKGHSSVAFISGLLDSYSSRCRMKAYEDCLMQWGITYRPEYVAMGDYSWESGYQAVKQFMGLEDTPTAVFAANDLMAMGAMKAAADMKIKVPKQLSVIGYDDIEMGNLCTPTLTTIHQPKYRVGAQAVRLMSEHLNKKEIPARHLWMETRVIERESVSGL